MMKVFPNRKTNTLNSHWFHLKKEIATVTTLPEVVCDKVNRNPASPYPRCLPEGSVCMKDIHNWKESWCSCLL